MTRQWVSQYTITAAPEGREQYSYIFQIDVTRAMQMDGTVLWAARWMGRCINRTGGWDVEPISSDRTDEWLAEHRFDLETALRLAEKAASEITVNGRKATDA